MFIAAKRPREDDAKSQFYVAIAYMLFNNVYRKYHHGTRLADGPLFALAKSGELPGALRCLAADVTAQMFSMMTRASLSPGDLDRDVDLDISVPLRDVMSRQTDADRSKVAIYSMAQLLLSTFVHEVNEASATSQTALAAVPCLPTTRKRVPSFANVPLDFEADMVRTTSSAAKLTPLYNASGTCYMNVVIQLLYNYVPLRARILRMHRSDVPDAQLRAVLVALQQIFLNMQDRVAYCTVNPLIKVLQARDSNFREYGGGSPVRSLSILTIMLTEIDPALDAYLHVTCEAQDASGRLTVLANLPASRADAYVTFALAHGGPLQVIYPHKGAHAPPTALLDTATYADGAAILAHFQAARRLVFTELHVTYVLYAVLYHVDSDTPHSHTMVSIHGFFDESFLHWHVFDDQRVLPIAHDELELPPVLGTGHSIVISALFYVDSEFLERTTAFTPEKEREYLEIDRFFVE